MKTSGHFDDDVSKRPDRVDIKEEWRERALREPEYLEPQNNGWTKRWIRVEEQGKWLRLVVLEDGETIHTNFWDRGFAEKLERWYRGLEPRLRRCPRNEN
jgi:hypothetical protein